MRFKWFQLFLGAMVAALFVPQAASQLQSLDFTSSGMVNAGGYGVANAQEKRDDEESRDWPERDEMQQNYQLSPGALVKVSGINGLVEVETGNTSAAEVHIVRSARNHADLEHHKIIIEQSGTGLYIHGEKEHDGWHHADVRQRVMLKLPRQIEFEANGINGRTSVGEIDGPVRLSGINGRVEVAQATGYSELSGINGNVVVTIARLGERGIRVSGINGGVELRFAEALNADLSVHGINGSVFADVPNVTVQGRMSRTEFNARIGTGGAPINVSGVNGRVRLASK